MADDTNKSKNRRPQNMADVGESQLPRDISRILAKSGYESQKYVEAQNVLGETEDINSFAETYPSATSNKRVQEELGKRSRAIRFMQQYEEQGRLRTVSQLESGINRHFGSINGEVQRGLNSFGAQQAALSTAAKMSPGQIEGQRTASQVRMNQLVEQIRDIGSNRLINRFGVEDEDARKEMTGLFGRVEQEKQRQIRLTGASMVHRAQGRDAVSVAENVAKAQMIQDNNPLHGAAQKLIEAFNAVADRAGKSADELKKLDSNLESSNQNFGGGRGYGGGGGGDKYGFAAGMLGAGGNLVQQIGVNQTLGEMQNRAGTANLENQKYDMYKKARAGDVASQMALTQWGNAEFFGSEVKTVQNVALGLHGAAGDLQGAAGVAKGGAAGAELGNPVTWVTGSGPGNAEAAQRGVKEAADGAAQAAIAAADIAAGVSGNQVSIAGRQNYMQAVQAVNAIPAEQLQGYRDYTTGLGTVARSMGGRGGAFMKAGQGMLPNLSDLGMSPEQVVQMSQFGQENMGSMFNIDQVRTARLLEKSGVGTKEENMQRMGMLAGAGSNNPQAGLAGVLEASFGKSLENAKTLTALVKNTSEMAGKSVAGLSGLDATAATATMLAANIDPNQANREVAVQRARTAAENADRIVTDQSVSFTNMSKMDRIQKMTGMSGDDAAIAGGIDIETLRTWAGKSASEQTKLLRGKGIHATSKTAGGTVKGLLDAAGISILARGTIPQSGVDTDAMYNKIIHHKKLSAEEQTQEGKAAFYGGFASAGDMERSIRGVGAKNDVNAVATAKDLLAGKGGSKALKDTDELLVGGFKQLSDAAHAAAKQLGGAARAMHVLLDLQRNADKEGGTKGEGEFSTAGAKAASSTWFSEGAKTLNTAAGKWDTIADRLIKYGIGHPSTHKPKSTRPLDSKRGKVH